MPKSVIKVLKFGGTSVGSAEALDRLVHIVKGEVISGSPVVVVSALSGVTNLLEAIVSEKTTKKTASLFRKLIARHLSLAREVLDFNLRARYLNILSDQVEALRDICRGADPDMRSHGILGSGELFSAPLVALLLEQHGVTAKPVDARHLIRVVRCHSGAWVVDRNQTRAMTESWHRKWKVGVLPVVTGYVGSQEDGKMITLGRGGSDYSAALIAEAVGASKFDRWTDVDGLYTADPNKVEGAGKFLFLLLEDASTWNEANQLGMHSEAFEPVLQACIPVHVRSTRYPQGDGTLIMPTHLPVRIEKDARDKIEHAARRGALELDSLNSGQKTTRNLA